MTSNDLLVTPKTFMDLYRPNLLEINSNADARSKAYRETRETIYSEASGFYPEEIGLRYEIDLRRLFISTTWLRSVAVADAQEPSLYMNELKRCTQYMGQAAMYLLKGTGYVKSATTCLIFDMSVPCTVSTKFRNQGEHFKTWLRDPKADPEYLNRVSPHISALKTLRNDVRDHSIDRESAEYLLKSIRKERILLERMKYGKSTDARRLIVSKRVTKQEKLKLNVLAYAKGLAESDNLMVRQVVQDKYSPNYQKEVVVDAEGCVLGYLKENRHEKKLYLVVSELKKAIPNYRKDYRYTHSQTTYLTELRGVQSRSMDEHHINKYCAVFDLRRPFDEPEVKVETSSEG